MKKFQLAVWVLLMGFSVPAFAESGDIHIGPSQPNLAPEKVGVVVEIPDALRAQLNQTQLEFLKLLEAKIRDEVFFWGGFQVELPRTLFGPGVQVVELAPFFLVDTQGHLHRMASEDDGTRKTLTDAQWDQLRAESVFSVEDPTRPGQYDVWAVTSKLVHKGSQDIRIRLEQHLANGLHHIVVEFPKALVGETGPSIRAGIRNLLQGLRNSLSLVVGLAETKPRYTSDEVQDLIETRRAASVFRRLRDAGVPESELALNDERLMAKAAPLLLELADQANARWQSRIPFERHRIELQVGSLGLSLGDGAQEIADRLEEARSEIYFEALLASTSLRAIDSSLPSLLVDQARARLFVAQREHRMAAQVEAYRASRENELRLEHPVLSKMPGWLAKQIDPEVHTYYLENRADWYEDISDDLRAKGLHNEAETLDLNYARVVQREPALREALAAETVPARQFPTRYFRIWQAKNWIITKEKGPDGVERYAGSAYQAMPDVYTDAEGWRLLNAWQRMKASFKGGLYYLVYTSFWNGPVGIKSLVLPEAFPNVYLVDPETGNLIPDASSLTETLTSRLSRIFPSILAARERFEAAPDSGFLSKNFKRPFHVFWHWWVRSWLQPSAVVSGQLAGFTAATSAAVVGTATSFVWAPMAGLMAAGWNGLIFDTDAPRSHSGRTPSGTSRVLPFLNEVLNRGFGKSALPAAFAAGRAAIWDPGLAIGHWAFGGTRWLTETGRDAMVRGLFWLGGARIPAQDPTFVLRRTQGLGVTDGYFYELSRDSTMVVTIALLEREELQETELRLRALIDQSPESVRTFFEPISILLNGSLRGKIWDDSSAKSPVLPRIHEAVTQQREEVAKAIAHRKDLLSGFLPDAQLGRVRMSRANLDRAVSEGAYLAQRFFEARLFPGLSQEETAAFWARRSLSDGDWPGLVQQLFSAQFGEAILAPMEDTAASFRVEVQPNGIDTMVETLLSGNDLSLDGAPVATWQAGSLTLPAPRAQMTSEQVAACANRLAAYGWGIQALQTRYGGK